MDLLQLSETVQQSAQYMSDFLAQQHSSLSFDPASSGIPPLSAENESFHRARDMLLEAASTLLQRCMSPEETILDLSFQALTASALRIAYNFDLAQAVPLRDHTTYTALAEITGFDTDTLSRTINHLISNAIFRELAPGRIVHSRLSYLMATDEKFRGFVGLYFEHAFVWSVHITDALAKWGSSEEPTETGLNAAEGTQATFWEFMGQNERVRKNFLDGFAYLAPADLGIRRLPLNGSDWAAGAPATVIDIGGHTGGISIGLAKCFPELDFIIQDLEHICRQGEKTLPAELSHRIRFQVHDMFDLQHGDPSKTIIFLLCKVLHDWSDKYACKILRAITPAMKPGDRIIIFDKVAPEAGTTAVFKGRFLRAADMQMWATFNGRERTASDFKALIAMADRRLRICSISSPMEMGMSRLVLSLDEECTVPRQ
ncbi:S-adenosyl-L-methionine-dependent methyltransferase [Aspergillus pseudonomiae]|uniref:S-adenosyl-L-methionine-dependent methyltransferase n=1 Tax=Aspergillus pseudonomiae TaxID=1506151 RepID=A0A5N6HYJ1_9EURO|nr:S-adenosyl-L-methionine-dependent methyltransferase [Aspergillus pseudonomiae]KAB8259466.1 S-adenosyl-L-methionine-dependent methyltransferase [Aspergillus pseudonomiae]KAE8404372.1 S-adenosyl-L-methionine-dependent methyltransferase [Aspergillus pseudonomiae]